MEFIIILLILSVCSIIFATIGGAAWFFTRPIPGTECTGEDPNARYEIDENGKCVFASCKSGYEFDDNSCMEILENEAVVEAVEAAVEMVDEEEEEVTPRANYVYDVSINVNSADPTVAAAINQIRLDDVAVIPDQIEILSPVNGEECLVRGGTACDDPDAMGLSDDKLLSYSSWKKGTSGPIEGTTIFSISSETKVKKITIDFLKSKFAPGLMVKENGVVKAFDTTNQGSSDSNDMIINYYLIDEAEA